VNDAQDVPGGLDLRKVEILIVMREVDDVVDLRHGFSDSPAIVKVDLQAFQAKWACLLREQIHFSDRSAIRPLPIAIILQCAFSWAIDRAKSAP
jgi:hypothetical protein